MTPQRLQIRGLGPGLEDRVWEATAFLGVGRLDNQQVLLTDASVSRRHAEIELTDEGWVVRDVGSTNGTFLNGVRIGRADQTLHKGDTIQCGNCSLIVAALEQLTPAGVETPGRGMQVELAVRNTLEQALLEAAPLEELAHIPGRDQLLTLLRIGRDFCGVTALDELLEGLLRDALAALKAQGGAIILVDEDSGQPGSTVVSTRQTESGPYYSKTLAQRALCAGESLLCHDIREELEGHHADSENGLATRSVICALLRSPRQRLGLLQLDRGPDQALFNRHELALADALAASVSSTIESVRSFLHREHALLLQTLTALAQTVDLRDDYTGSHTQRVTDFALLLADELHLRPALRVHLRNGTPLHDIGKIGISDEILRKPGRLSQEEIEYMRSHTWKGAALLETIPSFAPLVPIVRSHHERWDGRGYPDGLAGSDIPLPARIVAVADAFDAMTSDRPYRPAMTLDRALLEIHRQAGAQFDPDCAEAFVRLRSKLKEELGQRERMMATATFSIVPHPDKRLEARSRTQAIPREALAEFLRECESAGLRRRPSA
jgi:HD-GYP domain-containing protein (c-di-GMP phosphodiesterase class II)